MTPTAEIVEDWLPLDTALRAAAERHALLQTNGQRTVIYPRLLPGFTRICGGGEVHRVITPEAA
jgi:hypothetical protein